jgi:hypothetical protein
MKICAGCGGQAKIKYCSRECMDEHHVQERIKEMLATGVDRSSCCRISRRYLIQISNNTCAICKGTEWQGQHMPLTLDHINGNPEDNTIANLRVICPNCDRLTPFFGAKNRGNGRAWRKQRYQNGQSY